MSTGSLYYDPQDYQLLAMISQTVAKNRKGLSRIQPKLSPNGIIELSEPVELRMASAVLRLLDTLEQGKAEERLWALAALRDEVLVMARTYLRINTGRVLVHIMKELVRAKGDTEAQLRLAHDFRQAATGRHSVVRRLLHRHHMLEMPEEWNQAVFDHHVHDANTKGRKNATHLIMDAWLKGIRTLTVIYYNYVSPEAAQELLRAAEIMGIDVRLGLLFHAPHRGRLVDLIWIPHGFSGTEDFLAFLSKPAVSKLMTEGRSATRWLERRILHILDIWNETERLRLAPLLGGTADPLDAREFMTFVGNGQASLMHLAEFIHKKIFPLMEQRAAALQEALDSPDLTEGRRIETEASLETLDNFTTEAVMARLNDPRLCPESAYLQNSCDSPDCPDLLNLTPLNLLTRLEGLRAGCRITLNLAKLSAEDVLDLLWDCQGRITHLELFNFKDWQNGDLEPIKQINELQLAINDGSVPRLKQIILTMIRDAAPHPHGESARHEGDESGGEDLKISAEWQSPRIHKLRVILQNLPVLCGYYRSAKLGATMGTDSTSRPSVRFGMGLAYPETLPLRARRELNDPSRSAHLLLPLRSELREQVTYTAEAGDAPSLLTSLLRELPGLRHFGQQSHTEWIAASEKTEVINDGRCSIATIKDCVRGNIITLGGGNRATYNGFRRSVSEDLSFSDKMRYLNSHIANGLRFFIGFLPAFLAFMFTQSGVLAWLGAPLWFFISAFRNIVQSVLGNGGWHRSSLLHWKSYVSWSIVYVSLMFNGLNAVFLEPILRWQILEEGMGWNTVTAPVATYAVLSIACGLFKLATHAIQGFSARSLFVDVACTLLSLPMALFFHMMLLCAGGLLGWTPADLMPLTVFVVKLASDTAVGVADGITDRERNLRMRMSDYSIRLNAALTLYSRLEVLFPEKNVLTMVSHPAELLKKLEKLDPQLRLDIVINALDLMYFWFYQPRANYALHHHLQRFSKSERLVLLRMQEVLRLEQLVSQLLIHGLVGENFAGPLSFYVAHSRDYLHQMTAACLGERTARIRDC